MMYRGVSLHSFFDPHAQCRIFSLTPPTSAGKNKNLEKMWRTGQRQIPWITSTGLRFYICPSMNTPTLYPSLLYESILGHLVLIFHIKTRIHYKTCTLYFLLEKPVPLIFTRHHTPYPTRLLKKWWVLVALEFATPPPPSHGEKWVQAHPLVRYFLEQP